MERIDQLFGLLDEWRHLPNYQLERRADIFFALYLPEYLCKRFEVPCSLVLIPEFPVHLATIDERVQHNKSCKIDYVAVAEDHSAVLFVELKTDCASRRGEQDDYLKKAREKGMDALLEGLKKICRATAAPNKYLKLLELVERAGLCKLPESYREMRAADVWRELSFVPMKCTPQVVYLQPVAKADNEIGFDEFAKWAERFDDPVTRRFRDSLRSWVRSTAGCVS